MNHEKFASLITRGKVILARMAARALLQVTGLDGETFQNIELLLPPGYVANPTGGDVVLLQTNGLRSHVVALGGDSTADTVSDLKPGEVGLSRSGKTVILRVGSVTIVDPQQIILQAPQLFWSPDGVTMHTLATDTHTHISAAAGTPTSAPETASGMLT